MNKFEFSFRIHLHSGAKKMTAKNHQMRSKHLCILKKKIEKTAIMKHPTINTVRSIRQNKESHYLPSWLHLLESKTNNHRKKYNNTVVSRIFRYQKVIQLLLPNKNYVTLQS